MPRRVKRAQTTTWKTILLHPAVWFVVATIMLIYTATSLWQGHRDHLLVDSHYTIQANNIRVSSAPEWFEDSLSHTINQIVNSNSSLLDPNIVPETYDYLVGRPWIRKVDRVEKSISGIEIDVQFRDPVAFVDLDRNTGIPVDAEGVVVDRTILNETRYRILREELLRISLRQLRKTDSTIPWQRWQDSRIPFATTLCQFLEPFKKEMELFRVVSYDLPNSKSSPRLQIWTWNGTGVIWGSAPGYELAGEATAEAKILALKSFINTQGKLTNFERKGILDIDVSTGRAILVNSARRAERDDFRNNILK